MTTTQQTDRLRVALREMADLEEVIQSATGTLSDTVSDHAGVRDFLSDIGRQAGTHVEAIRTRLLNMPDGAAAEHTPQEQPQRGSILDRHQTFAGAHPASASLRSIHSLQRRVNSPSPARLPASTACEMYASSRPAMNGRLNGIRSPETAAPLVCALSSLLRAIFLSRPGRGQIRA